MPLQQALPEKRLVAKMDWLEFTIKDSEPYEVIENLLLLEHGEFTKLNRGRFGYNSQVKWENGHVYVLYNEDEDGEYMDDDMGVHVLMTGQGCASFSTNCDLRHLVMLIIGCANYKFSRIDLAIDDIGDRYIKFDKLAKCALRGDYVTKWCKWDEVNSRKTGGTQEFVGRTMYFGSQSSDIFCRIYNKALEMLSKQDDDDENEIPEDWTRLEIIYKKDRANIIAEQLVNHEDVGYIVKSTLNNYLRFIKPNHDANRSRWPMYKWWERFVRDAGTLKLTRSEELPDIDKMKEWVDKQISPTLAAIMTAHGGDTAWLYSILSKAKGRLKKRHNDAILTYWERNENDKEN
ncbi:replication initiation factor domain-containing protein [Lactobacillaceae bacterium Melli_B4]